MRPEQLIAQAIKDRSEYTAIQRCYPGPIKVTEADRSQALRFVESQLLKSTPRVPRKNL